ncbi:MAG: MBL fold metallo-hydrolase [Paracoccaceae bacterium]|nr:MBL fold metallo-hydrolase [Paracoccaceae bacterium]
MDLEDGYYQVEALDADTFAIGEPLYKQQNWSFLLIGTDRALLFDTGSYFGDITGVVGRRVQVPLTAMPSHMHYDHLGNVLRFGHVALPDLPVLRACAEGDWVEPTETLFLGVHENREAPRFQVNEWLEIGSRVDLGGRVVELIHTPGHTPDSVSLWEPVRERLYASDFLCRGQLYGHTPGARLDQYLATARRVAALIGPGTAIYGAHGNAGPDKTGGDRPSEPPLLDLGDLTALIRNLEALEADPPKLSGDQTVIVPVSDRTELVVGAEGLVLGG